MDIDIYFQDSISHTDDDDDEPLVTEEIRNSSKIGPKSRIGPKRKMGPKSQIEQNRIIDDNEPLMKKIKTEETASSIKSKIGPKSRIVPKRRIGPKSKIGPKSQRSQEDTDNKDENQEITAVEVFSFFFVPFLTYYSPLVDFFEVFY